MGTSSSYGGPSGAGALLPPWASPVAENETGDHGATEDSGAEAQDTEEEETEVPANTWAQAKAAMSRLASSGSSGHAGQERIRRAGSAFVGAQGGYRSARRAAVAGRSTAQRLGGFLGSIVSDGASAAIERFDLQKFVGQGIDTLLTAVVDQLAPTGGQLEEAAARAALVETLAELFTETGVAEEGLESLESLGEEDVASAMQLFVVNYIYERLIQTLARRLENRPVKEVAKLERDIKLFISATIEYDLSDTDVLSIDWYGPEGRQFIDRIYEDGYSLIENV